MSPGVNGHLGYRQHVLHMCSAWPACPQMRGEWAERRTGSNKQRLSRGGGTGVYDDGHLVESPVALRRCHLNQPVRPAQLQCSRREHTVSLLCEPPYMQPRYDGHHHSNKCVAPRQGWARHAASQNSFTGKLTSPTKTAAGPTHTLAGAGRGAGWWGHAAAGAQPVGTAQQQPAPTLQGPKVD